MSAGNALHVRRWGRRFRLPSPLAGDSGPGTERLQFAAWISGSLIALCVVILLMDFAQGFRREPIDNQIIKALQVQVNSDASLAPKLAGELKRITDRHRSRRSRDRVVAWLLILASSIFLTAAKRVVQPASPPPAASRPSAPALGAIPSRDPNGAVLAQPRPIDLSFVDQLVAREGRGKESTIVLLQAIQTHYRYLPDEALHRLVELTDITPAEVAGTSSFYGQFRRSPVGRHVVRVCHGTACHVAGARQITEELRRHLAIPEGADTDADRLFTVDEVACLGCCSLAPVLTVDGQTSGRLTPTTACDALAVLEKTETA